MTRGLRAVAPAVVLCALAGCGVRPTGVVNAGEAPTATATSLPHTQVYFLLDGRPTPATRTVAPWDTQAVFDALIAGPTAQEREHGLRTALTPDMTIRVVGSRAVFVEYPNAYAKKTMIGYTQVYCTALLLPGAPIVKMPGAPDQKYLFATEQEARAGVDVCPGAAIKPEVGGVPSSSEPGPDGTLPGAKPEPTDSVPVPQPTGPARKLQRLPKPSRSG